MTDKTFGDFLKQVITNRKMSISKLAELTETKSKTTIVRLINNKSGKKSINHFAKKLLDVIELTDGEKEELDSIIKSTSASPVENRVTKNLQLLFSDTPNIFTNSICTAYNAEEKGEKMSMHDIFSICTDKKSTIIIKEIASVELILALNNLIHQTTKDGLSPVISHFFKADEGVEAKGMQLLAVMKLSTYLGYNAYECKRCCSMTKKIIILTEDKNCINMRMVQFTDVNKFYYIDTQISDVLYDHILFEKRNMVNNATPLRSKPLRRNQLAEMLDVLKEYDKIPSLQINSSISYMMIPFDIQKRLFEECNYIGMGREHPYIQKIYSLLQERASFLASCGIPRKFIWTKSGLKSFLKTGKTGDHFQPFSRLSNEECKQTLRFITNIKGSQYRVLKDSFHVFDTEFVIHEDNGISIYDPIWGWWDGFTSANISDKRMVKLIADFYNNELWEKACYTEKESEKIIEKML